MTVGLRNLAAGFDEYVDWATDPTPRVGFGLPFFDEPTNGGIGKSELLLINARTSVGKTAIGLNIIRANPAMPALVFSLEMGWRMLAARLAAMHTGVSTRSLEQRLRSGETPAEITSTIEAFPRLLADDTPGLNIKTMSEQMLKASETVGEPIRIVLIDYLELVGGVPSLSASEGVDKVARQLKNFARKHDASVVVLHQVSKSTGGSGAEPLEMGAGKYGGDEAADYIVGAYRTCLRKGITPQEFQREKDQIHLQLLKNRAGEARPAGVLHRLDSTCLRLSEWRENVWQREITQVVANPMDDEDYREVVAPWTQ